jgi:hypothetical protein
MTMHIRTVNGNYLNAGFVSYDNGELRDMGRVRVGRLPPMTTRQFLEHSVGTLIDHIVPKLDVVTRLSWSITAERTRDTVKGLQIYDPPMSTSAGASHSPDAPSDFLTETIQEYEHTVMANALSGLVQHYPRSPFTAIQNGRRVRIAAPGQAGPYIIKATALFALTNHILSGSPEGWPRHGGTYVEVLDHAADLDEVLNPVVM